MASITFVADILSVVGPQKVSKGKQNWNVLEVAFKRDGEKVEGKKLVDFNNKEIFAQAEKFKAGEKYTITSEKNETTGYWEWKSINAGGVSPDAGAKEQSPQSASGHTSTVSTGGAAGRVTGSNYETPEERKLRRDWEIEKNEYIVRQSCLDKALELLKHNSQGKDIHEDAIMKIADKFGAYVYKTRVQDLENDIPI